MIQTVNYNKVCDKCGGEPHIWGERDGFFGKVPVLLGICDKCELGIIKPKEVIQHYNKIEPTITYD